MFEDGADIFSSLQFPDRLLGSPFPPFNGQWAAAGKSFSRG
jgi:hypothetical protein